MPTYRGKVVVASLVLLRCTGGFRARPVPEKLVAKQDRVGMQHPTV